jgi:hypothetical protein
VTIRDLAIYGFGDDSGANNNSANIGAIGDAYDRLTITGNLIGFSASAPSFTAAARASREASATASTSGRRTDDRTDRPPAIPHRNGAPERLDRRQRDQASGGRACNHDGINLSPGAPHHPGQPHRRTAPGVDINTDADPCRLHNTITNNVCSRRSRRPACAFMGRRGNVVTAM